MATESMRNADINPRSIVSVCLCSQESSMMSQLRSPGPSEDQPSAFAVISTRSTKKIENKDYHACFEMARNEKDRSDQMQIAEDKLSQQHTDAVG